MSEEKEDIRWDSAPPKVDGKPFFVDCKFYVTSVYSIDTVKFTFCIRYTFGMRWCDPRLIGRKQLPTLPPNLWGPRVRVRDALPEGFKEDQESFSLEDPKTGLLKRVIMCNATCRNEGMLIENLRDFPFDRQSIRVTLRTNSSFQSKDQNTIGSLEQGRDYYVRWIDPRGTAIDDFPLRVKRSAFKTCGDWAFTAAEWKLENDWKTDSVQNSSLVVDLHISRNYTFYIYKLLIPLMGLTILSMTTLYLPVSGPEASISDRLNSVATWYLASFGLLYITSEYMPEVEYLVSEISNRIHALP